MINPFEAVQRYDFGQFFRQIVGDHNQRGLIDGFARFQSAEFVPPPDPIQLTEARKKILENPDYIRFRLDMERQVREYVASQKATPGQVVYLFGRPPSSESPQSHPTTPDMIELWHMAAHRVFTKGSSIGVELRSIEKDGPYPEAQGTTESFFLYNALINNHPEVIVGVPNTELCFYPRPRNKTKCDG